LGSKIKVFSFNIKVFGCTLKVFIFEKKTSEAILRSLFSKEGLLPRQKALYFRQKVDKNAFEVHFGGGKPRKWACFEA